MNEALKHGMSIMENYFEKLDAESTNQDEDDDDQDNEYTNQANKLDQNKDIVIYEAKDPYVLRSLPYLIGSQLYMENDHVGLKDLESEDESDEELEEDEPEDEANAEDSESDESSEVEEEDQENETDIQAMDQFEQISRSQTGNSEKKKPGPVQQTKAKNDFFDSLSEEDDEDLFKPKMKNVNR
jgi:WASH complex subunit FAM21